MKVLMIPTFFGGISHWRFEVPARTLNQAGHEVTCPTADQMDLAIRKHGTFKDWIMEEMPKYDLVHAGYSAMDEFPIGLFTARDKHNKPVILDLDDNIDAVPPYNSGWRAFRPGGVGQRVVKTALKYADGVTFSTTPLAEAMGYINPNHAVLENWIDPADWAYPTAPNRRLDKGIRIMLTGGHGRYGDWQIVQKPLEALMAKHPDLRLFFIGATPDWVAQWMPSPTDPRANRAFYIQPTEKVGLFNQIVQWIKPDILLSPVQDNDFNKSKSGLKFLEAALAEAAFICTDYPTYSNAPMGTCLKVDNTYAQWEESLSYLIESPQLRSRLAGRAKDHVLAHCQAKDYIEPRLTFYEEVCLGRSRQFLDGQPALDQSATS